MIGIIIGGVFGVPVLWSVIVFNSFVRLSNDVKNAWHQIDVQLKRRHDLIPNLVEAVKGYMAYEQDALERVAVARSFAMRASDMKLKAKAEDSLTGEMKSLLALAENYPSLKADKQIARLMEELVSTENRIAFARQHYNDLVADMGYKIQSMPDGIIGQAFGFIQPEFFKPEFFKPEE